MCDVRCVMGVVNFLGFDLMIQEKKEKERKKLPSNFQVFLWHSKIDSL